MMLFVIISVQLSVEHLIAHGSATPSTLEQLPVYFYLITGCLQHDCFYIGQFTLSVHYAIERG